MTVEQATPADVYVAASTAVRRHLMDSWMKTQQDMVNGNTKAVGYLSAEFLMGKQLRNALLNAGLTEQFDEAVEQLGFDYQDVVDAEYEPALGNGGLGRLAACFIDSLASLGVPAFGYGIQYQYGIFKQSFNEQGQQIENPEYWLANEEPWAMWTTTVRSAWTSAATWPTRTASACGTRPPACAPCRSTTWCRATPRAA